MAEAGCSIAFGRLGSQLGQHLPGFGNEVCALKALREIQRRCRDSDRFFMPPGSPFSRLTGYGHYHDTYEKTGGAWLLKTMRFTRIWVETS